MQGDIIRRPNPQNEPSVSSPTHDGAKPASVPVQQPPSPTRPIDDVHKSQHQEPKPAEVLAQDAKPRSKRPAGIIITAVLVCAGLMGAAVYLGLQQGSDSKETSSKQPTSQQAATADNQAAEDEANAALDEALLLPSSQEDLSGELSDQTLGL